MKYKSQTENIFCVHVKKERNIQERTEYIHTLAHTHKYTNHGIIPSDGSFPVHAVCVVATACVRMPSTERNHVNGCRATSLSRTHTRQFVRRFGGRRRKTVYTRLRSVRPPPKSQHRMLRTNRTTGFSFTDRCLCTLLRSLLCVYARACECVFAFVECGRFVFIFAVRAAIERGFGFPNAIRLAKRMRHIRHR